MHICVLHVTPNMLSARWRLFCVFVCLSACVCACVRAYVRTSQISWALYRFSDLLQESERGFWGGGEIEE